MKLQFSIRDLLQWTAVIALLAAYYRLRPSPESSYWVFPLAVFTTVFANKFWRVGFVEKHPQAAVPIFVGVVLALSALCGLLDEGTSLLCWFASCMILGGTGAGMMVGSCPYPEIRIIARVVLVIAGAYVGAIVAFYSFFTILGHHFHIC